MCACDHVLLCGALRALLYDLALCSVRQPVMHFLAHCVCRGAPPAAHGVTPCVSVVFPLFGLSSYVLRLSRLLPFAACCWQFLVLQSQKQLLPLHASCVQQISDSRPSISGECYDKMTPPRSCSTIFTRAYGSTCMLALGELMFDCSCRSLVLEWRCLVVRVGFSPVAGFPFTPPFGNAVVFPLA